jgi:hypothetical protein
MAKIIISELHPVDSEIFLTDPNDLDFMYIYGGDGGEAYIADQTFDLIIKLFETAISIIAINSITQIVMLFNDE